MTTKTIQEANSATNTFADQWAPPIVENVPLELLKLGHNARQKSNSGNLEELAQTIKAFGVLFPILATRTDSEKPTAAGEPYGIVVAGSRRYRASLIAGCETIPVRWIEANEIEAGKIGLIENMQRERLDPFAESKEIERLLGLGLPLVEAANELGRSPAYVARRRNLRTLVPALRKQLWTSPKDGEAWPIGHLEMLAAVAPELQQSVVDDAWPAYNRDAPPSRGELAMSVADACRILARAPWDLASDNVAPGTVACVECPETSDHSPGLFEEVNAKTKRPKSPNRCRNGNCWAKKMAAFRADKIQRAKEAHGSDVLLIEGAPDIDAPEPPNCRPAEKVLESWKVEACKKSDPGATRALVVTGRGIGQTRWVRKSNLGSGASAKPAKVPASQLDDAGKLKRAEERLASKRTAYAVGVVADRIQELCDGGTEIGALEFFAQAADVEQGQEFKHSKLPVFLLGMISAYGLGPAWDFISGDKRERAFARCDLEALVARILVPIGGALRFSGATPPDEVVTEAAWLARTFRICLPGKPKGDYWDALLAAANVDVPAPKSLEALRAKLAKGATPAKPKPKAKKRATKTTAKGAKTKGGAK